MVAVKHSCNIVGLKYVVVRVIAENERSHIVLVAGITSTNLTSVTTWDILLSSLETLHQSDNIVKCSLVQNVSK